MRKVGGSFVGVISATPSSRDGSVVPDPGLIRKSRNSEGPVVNEARVFYHIHQCKTLTCTSRASNSELA